MVPKINNKKSEDIKKENIFLVAFKILIAPTIFALLVAGLMVLNATIWSDESLSEEDGDLACVNIVNDELTWKNKIVFSERKGSLYMEYLPDGTKTYYRCTMFLNPPYL